MHKFLRIMGLSTCFCLIAACGSNSDDDFITIKCGPCRIFVTASNFDGNLGGIAGADSACMSDTNYPGTGTYKAMLVDGTNRVATVTDNTGDGQVDWVLYANTDYVRADGTTPIMTTDANGLFVFGTLTNSVSTTAGSVWTGLLSSWVTHTNSHCTAWTSNSGAVNGTYGDATSTSNFGFAIASESTLCSDATLSLYCVQQ